MASPPKPGLSLQTVVVASLASLSAALLTSRLLPPGATVFTAALTPVIVALVSDMLHRPARRVTELRSRRTAVLREPARMGGGPGEGRWVPLEPDSFDHDPVVTNGGGVPRVSGRRDRRLHPKVIAATAAAGFILAAGVLTLPELIFGGAAAADRKTTLFGGAAKPAKPESKATEQQPQQTVTEPAPAQETPPAPQDPEAAPQPTQTETSPAPEPTPAPVPEPTPAPSP
jgi:hypothetical protein